MRDLYFICECARVPAVTNLLYNNNAKVELLESSPRAGLRAFEKKKKERESARVSNTTYNSPRVVLGEKT